MEDSSDDDEEILIVLDAAFIMANEIVDGDSDSSDSTTEWGGNKEGKAPSVPRNFAVAYNMLARHYFSGTESLYEEPTFKRRFGTTQGVVSRLMNVVMGIEPFVLNTDIFSHNPGIRLLFCFVAAMRMLKYGDSADHLDEHLQMSDTNETFLPYHQFYVQG